MIEGRPSATAFRVAVSRAAHQLLDRPIVFNDPVAVAIVGRTAEASILGRRAHFNGIFSLALRAFLVARSRVTEDLLADAYARGVRQYVVLGAGLDTVAYRHPHSGLRVFELDFPATQEWKRTRLAEAGIAVPPNVVFASCDFVRESVVERLLVAGLDPATPTFVSWLGVTMYLDRAVVLDTIRMLLPFIGAPGGLVFDYFGHVEKRNLFLRFASWLVSRRLARMGEPLRSVFETNEFIATLRALGCTRAEDFDLVALNARFFANRPGRLIARGRGHVMYAQG